MQALNEPLIPTVFLTDDAIRCRAQGRRICGAASSSTVGWGGEPGRAIDTQIEHSTAWGRKSCTHTDAGEFHERNIDGSMHGPAWWQVDLGEGALVNHVDLWHRTDCCQDRLEKASVYVSESPDYTTGTKCGQLSDHSQKPEVSQCGQVFGRYVTVAHAHSEGGGSSGGAVITICEAKVFGIRGRVDTASCRCTPRCAQDSLNMAVRCCADTNPTAAGQACTTAPGYTGPLKPALTGSSWTSYLLYAALAIVGIIALVKLSPLLLSKIPSLGGKGAGLQTSITGGGGGGGGDSICEWRHLLTTLRTCF